MISNLRLPLAVDEVTELAGLVSNLAADAPSLEEYMGADIVRASGC